MSKVPQSIPALTQDVKGAWHRFLDAFEPLRPDLYRFCRQLTGSPWDAEDLVQDTLARAFVIVGTLFHDLENPRGWLLRVASNLWIDRVRRARRELLVEAPEATQAEPSLERDPRVTREAAGTLLVRLSPQERAAVVLKDVFELSLEEIAEVLATTTGAVKAALHRGRGRLREVGESAPVAARPVLDAFVAAFNAGDIQGLTALLLDTSVVEIVGVVTEYGPEPPADSYTGSFAGTIAPISYDERGGVPPELLEGYLSGSPRCEVRDYHGTPIVLFWWDHEDGPAVRTFMLVETDGDRVARVRNYFFTPDVIAEVCRELGVPYRTNGYRYWRRAGEGAPS